MTKHVPAPLQELELGPYCSKLSGKRLAFVAALVFEVPSGKGAAEAAGVIAGYSATEARRLSRDKSVSAAVKELMEQRMILEGPAALDTLREEMNNPYGKDRTKAAGMILDRVIPSKQHLTLETTAPVDRTAETLKHLQHMLDIGASEDVLVNEFGTIGLKHYRALLDKQRMDNAKVIDAEAIEIEPTPKEAPKRIETLDDLI